MFMLPNIFIFETMSCFFFNTNESVLSGRLKMGGGWERKITK